MVSPWFASRVVEIDWGYPDICKPDETLALLTGARIFRKLDSNSGPWQMLLSEQSKLLKTLITT